MTRLWLMRHAPTAWSVEKRLQGRNDLGLSQRGREAITKWHLPEAVLGCDWYVSPLRRCRQTANQLGLQSVRIEPRLIEMDWGEWEGQTARELEATTADGLAAQEAQGLDLQPPGGESPRDVQGRVRSWLDERAEAGNDVAAITHKGVIRTIYALASGWDMTKPPPEKLRSDHIHAFFLAAALKPRVDRLNVSLTSK